MDISRLMLPRPALTLKKTFYGMVHFVTADDLTRQLVIDMGGGGPLTLQFVFGALTPTTFTRI